MTKVWRQREYEETRKNKLIRKSPVFKKYVQSMFDSNCRERREHGQKEFNNVFSYYRTHHKWLLHKFIEEKQPKPKKKGKDYTKCSDVELLRIHDDLKRTPLVDCMITGEITIELINRGWRKLDDETWTWELP